MFIILHDYHTNAIINLRYKAPLFLIKKMAIKWACLYFNLMSDAVTLNWRDQNQNQRRSKPEVERTKVNNSAFIFVLYQFPSDVISAITV